MDVIQHAARNADGQDGEVAASFVLDAARDVHDHALVQLDLLIVDGHGPLAVDDVVELVGALVIVKLGVVDLYVMHFGGGAVLLLDEAANLAAGFGPGGDVGGVAAEETGYGGHCLVSYGFCGGRTKALNWPVSAHAFSKLCKEVVCGPVAK